MKRKIIPKSDTFGKIGTYQTTEDFQYEVVNYMRDVMCWGGMFEEEVDAVVTALHKLGYVKIGK
jgi:hypothetical protein